jgi:hypothetical protein
VRIDSRGSQTELEVEPLTDRAQVSPVVEKFRAKYGDGDMNRYYSKLDVAVVGRAR